jgi:hypothetical protein
MHQAVQKIITLAKSAGYSFEFCKGEPYGILTRAYESPVVIDKGGRNLPVLVKGNLVPEPKASLLTPDFGKLKPLSKVKKGTPVRFKPNGEVWVRGAYDRGSHAYTLINYADEGRKAISKEGTTEVLVDFIF